MPGSEEIKDRIERLESLESIRQLAAKYALAVDMRAFDALVLLYCEDVRVGASGVGRLALLQSFKEALRPFESTAHLVGTHVIQLLGRDSAEGVVYCRVEQAMRAQCVIAHVMYQDTYEKPDDRWLFKHRIPRIWYVTESNAPPIGPDKVRWPGTAPRAGTMHDYSPSWSGAPQPSEVVAKANFHELRFLQQIRYPYPHTHFSAPEAG